MLKVTVRACRRVSGMRRDSTDAANTAIGCTCSGDAVRDSRSAISVNFIHMHKNDHGRGKLRFQCLVTVKEIGESGFRSFGFYRILCFFYEKLQCC